MFAKVGLQNSTVCFSLKWGLPRMRSWILIVCVMRKPCDEETEDPISRYHDWSWFLSMNTIYQTLTGHLFAAFPCIFSWNIVQSCCSSPKKCKGKPAISLVLLLSTLYVSTCRLVIVLSHGWWFGLSSTGSVVDLRLTTCSNWFAVLTLVRGWYFVGLKYHDCWRFWDASTVDTCFSWQQQWEIIDAETQEINFMFIVLDAEKYNGQRVEQNSNRKILIGVCQWDIDGCILHWEQGGCVLQLTSW